VVVSMVVFVFMARTIATRIPSRKNAPQRAQGTSK